MSLIILLGISFCLFLFKATPEEQRRDVILTQTLLDLTSNNTCITNYALIDEYFLNLKKNNIQPLNPRDNRNQIQKIVNRVNFQKVLQDITSPIYKICPFKSYTYERTPNMNTTLTNLSLEYTLQRYSYLTDNIAVEKIDQLLDLLPYDLKGDFKIVRYLIINHQLYVDSWPRQYMDDLEDYTIVRNIRPFLKQLPDMLFLSFGRDQLHMKIIKDFLTFSNKGSHEMDGYCEIYKRMIINLPSFMRSKDLHDELEFNKLLYVDSYVYNSKWPSIIQKVKKASIENPWETKIQKCFWRGIFSGISFEDVDYYSDIKKYFLRMHVVNLTNTYPDLFDHQPTNITGAIKKRDKQLNITYQSQPIISQEAHLKYKYLLSVDGWSAVWERIPWIMFSNSLLLKHETGKVQWFHDQLIPYFHYIPLKADLSDIVQKMQFVKTNQEFVKNITLNANKFAESRFYYDQLHRTSIDILKKYATYQKMEVSFLQKLNIAINNPKNRTQMLEMLTKLKIKLFIGLAFVILVVIILIVHNRNSKQRSEQKNKPKTIRNQESKQFEKTQKVNDLVIQ